MSRDESLQQILDWAPIKQALRPGMMVPLPGRRSTSRATLEVIRRLTAPDRQRARVEYLIRAAEARVNGVLFENGDFSAGPGHPASKPYIGINPNWPVHLAARENINYRNAAIWALLRAPAVELIPPGDNSPSRRRAWQAAARQAAIRIQRERLGGRLMRIMPKFPHLLAEIQNEAGYWDDEFEIKAFFTVGELYELATGEIRRLYWRAFLADQPDGIAQALFLWWAPILDMAIREMQESASDSA